MVHQCQKTGKCASPEVKKTAKSIKKGDATDFAKTKHKGLPEKKDENKLSFTGLWEQIQAKKPKKITEDIAYSTADHAELPMIIDGDSVFITSQNIIIHNYRMIGEVKPDGVYVIPSYKNYRNDIQQAYNVYKINPSMYQTHR